MEGVGKAETLNIEHILSFSLSLTHTHTCTPTRTNAHNPFLFH